ncbi:MAG: porin family protein [Tatlockia sp.]|nr:porin family protein [Tatlockia sp.]
MKKIILGLCLVLPSVLFAGESGITQIITPTNWNGFYIGGNLGGLFSKFHGSVSDAPYIDNSGVYFPSFAQPYNANQHRFAGGAQLGYLYQINQFIYGTEIGLLGFNLNNKHTLKKEEVGQFINIFKSGDSFSSKSKWQASWIARIGSPIQNWLVYGLGGVAIMNHEISTQITSIVIDGDLFPASQGSEIKTLVGGTVGLGSEYALCSNFRIGLEYRYTDFGKRQYRVGQSAVSSLPNGFIFTDLHANSKLVNNSVLVRFNYYFN